VSAKCCIKIKKISCHLQFHIKIKMQLFSIKVHDAGDNHATSTYARCMVSKNSSVATSINQPSDVTLYQPLLLPNGGRYSGDVTEAEVSGVDLAMSDADGGEDLANGVVDRTHTHAHPDLDEAAPEPGLDLKAADAGHTTPDATEAQTSKAGTPA
jgi:hypothetical protein